MTGSARARGRGRRLQGQRGATLLEIMLVVSIIALVASFAIPSLQDAKRAANEAAAVAMSRALFDAQQQYRRQHGTPTTPYAISLPELDLKGLLPGNLRNGTGVFQRDGYRFLTIAFSVDGTFAVCAFPEAFGKTGNYSFLIRDDGTIYRRKAAGMFVDPALGEPVGK